MSLYQPHQKIDHYEILSRLADQQGCQRYLAQDWMGYQQVVLVVPDDAQVGGRFLFERLRAEARLTATLNHPAWQRLHYQEARHQKTPYLVQEYLQGQTLREVMHAAPSTRLLGREVVRIGMAVCEALMDLHAAGIVHRDLKPEHILLLDTGNVKVTGLLLTERLGTVRRQWKSILFPAGTPDYLAPELWWGHPGSVQSDIYAVGTILYELLCGHLPFAGQTCYPFLIPQLSNDPENVSRVFPSADLKLATVVMRTIRRDPTNRYASIAELLHDLTHLDTVLPSIYLPAPPLWGGRYRPILFLLWLLLLVLFSLVAIGVLAQWIATGR